MNVKCNLMHGCYTPSMCEFAQVCTYSPMGAALKEEKLMKCYADTRDHCHNPSACKNTGKCIYEEELNRSRLEPGMVKTIKPRIPEFIEILEASKAIHLKKNQDYANDNNSFANFERSSELISWFQNPIDRSFIALIGTKLARIAELRDGRIPNNESLDDSFIDLVTYCGLWAAYVKRSKM